MRNLYHCGLAYRESLSSRPHEDKITWLHTADGQYTARSAYRIQFLGMASSMTAKITWKTKAPPKCRFFTWLMLQNRIWTAARLMLRQWPNDYFCQLCVRNLETVSHLFQECGYSRSVWDKVGSWVSAAALRPTHWTQTEDLGQWYADMGNSGTRDARDGVRSMIMLTTWELWRERNNQVFHRSSRTLEQVFRAIQEEARTWIWAGNRGLEAGPALGVGRVCGRPWPLILVGLSPYSRY